MTLNIPNGNMCLQWKLLRNAFVFSGKFDTAGVAEGYPDENIGKVKELRLNVHTESDNWAILSEVSYYNIIFLFFFINMDNTLYSIYTAEL